jgi:hypothetical protein
MSAEIDTTVWTPVARCANARFFEIEPQILVVVPDENSTDDEDSAKESIRIQIDYMRTRKFRAGVIVLTDSVAEQSSAARSVYKNEADPKYHACFALVASSMLGRAVASVFLGLHRPRVPTRFFASLDEAIEWSREMVRSS